MNIEQAIAQNTKSKLFVSLASRPGKTGMMFYDALFNFYGIDANYIACSCDNLEKDLDLAKTHCNGASITMPFKKQALEYLDETDSSIAVNTIKIIDGKLLGYNCDLVGLHKLLYRLMYGIKINLLGDGAMADNIKSFCSVNQYSRKLGNWDERHSQCDMLINTTSIGMNKDECPVDQLNASIVVDCVIGNTLLIQQAKNKNCRVITGVDIYKLQLQEQFKIYTGITPDMELIEKTAQRIFNDI